MTVVVCYCVILYSQYILTKKQEYYRIRKQTALDRGQTDRISLTHDLDLDQ